LRTEIRSDQAIVPGFETITFADTATGQEIPSLSASYLLGVDRVTRENVAGHGDGIGEGHYSFPFDAGKTETYPFWNEGNPTNLDCTYVSEGTFEGEKVYVFHMETPDEGLPLAAGFLPPDLKEYVAAMCIHRGDNED